MTTAEAIEEINEQVELIGRDYADEIPEYLEVLKMAVEALRKQEPKKPTHKEKNLYCPNCDHWLLWDDAIPNEWDNHCGICGQAIDWED